MHQFTVSKSQASANPHLPHLLKELDQLRDQRARLYFTYITGDDDPFGESDKPERASFMFVTPSKQVHLGLGMLSWDGQLHLAWLLEHEFQDGPDMSQLILYMDEREKGILVTRTDEIDGSIVFTLSSVN